MLLTGLLSMACSVYFLKQPKNHLPRGSITHSGLDLSMSIIKKKKSPTNVPMGDSDGGKFVNSGSFFPSDQSLHQVDKLFDVTSGSSIIITPTRSRQCTRATRRNQCRDSQGNMKLSLFVRYSKADIEKANKFNNTDKFQMSFTK